MQNKEKMTNICKCGHQKQFHSDGKQRMVSVGHQYKGNYCTYLECTCKKFEAQGCGKRLEVRFEGQADRIASYCGIMNVLCDECKPKNHSQQEKGSNR